MFKFSGTSKTYWESSYFGGVKRVLVEYPFYGLNYDLYAYLNPSSKAGSELSIYQIDKLVNILINQALHSKDNKNQLRNDYKKELKKTLSSPSLLKMRTVTINGRPKIAIEIPKHILDSFIKYVKQGELEPIFSEYGDSITDKSSKVMIYSDVPNQESGDSKETKDSQEEPHDSEENEKPKFSEGLIDHYSATVSNKFVDSFKDKKNVEDFTVSVRNMPTGASTSLFQEEVVFAKKLAQMLDINHDSKPDVVKNLLHGKMDTDKLPEVLSGNNRVYTKTLENQSLKPFKVIVLGDYSGSMNHAWRGPTPITFQKKVMKSLFHMFHDVLGMDDIEFYGHSGVDEPILYKFHSPEYPHFMETFNGYIPLEENYDGPIIEHIHKMVRAKTNNPVLLISLSDGQPSGQNYGGKKANANMKRILEKVKRDNFVTVGIGMNYTHESNLYQYSVTINDLSSTSSVAQIINRAVKENLIVED